MNSNEWHLDTSIAAGGRSKMLHFVMYISNSILFVIQLIFLIYFLIVRLWSYWVKIPLQFVVRYIPSAKECPLLLQLPDGEISKTNSFISPVSYYTFIIFKFSVLWFFLWNVPIWINFDDWHVTDVGRCYCLESPNLSEGFRK